MRLVPLVPFALLAAAGCGAPAPAAAPRVHKKPAPIASIADVDFKNRSYTPSCLAGGRVIVKDGERVTSSTSRPPSSAPGT